MKKVAVILLSLLLLTSTYTVYAQEVTPQNLELTVYKDGTVKAVYDVETDPTKVRVEVELFGSSFDNLVVRDDEDLPIEVSTQGSIASIESLGALELHIVYLTSTLTSNEGALWTLNVSSPASTRVILPVGSEIIDLSALPFGSGTIDGKTYFDFDPGDLIVSYLLGLPEIDPEPEPTPSPEVVSAAKKMMKWDLFIRREGKFNKILPAQTRNRQIQKGANIVREGLSATFRVGPTKTEATREDIIFTPNPNIFRQNVIRKGVRIPTPNQFIERKSFRLDSSKEVFDIQAAKRAAPKKQKKSNSIMEFIS